MSWQLGSSAVLALALTGGFWWYERTRPDARVVALVGTLAAFAALGRIAFAAVPNVKPTTDIVLIAGFALGGAPGFAVGAIAGLSSNFFFGQGPWTPWQMAAWGVTGIVGAALAAASRRRRGAAAQPTIGRWPLSIVCGVVGFAFTAVQDAGDWVTYSDHSAGALLAYVGQGLAFDAVHAVGCVAFALAIGPSLIRSLQRFARRLHVEWEPPGTAVDAAGPPPRGSTGGGAPGAAVASALLAIALAGSIATPARAAVSAAAAVRAGTQYLLSAENSDGGLGAAPGEASDGLDSGWAALGLASAGVDLNRVSRGGGSLVAYIEAGAGSDDIGSLERTILVARAAGLSPTDFAGHDLVAALLRHIRRDGSVSDQVNLTTFAILALRAAGEGVPARTLDWLVAQHDHDGGFNFEGAGGSSDVDDTGAALEALAFDPPAGVVRRAAVAYLRRQQNRDGGFSGGPGAGSNAQSTAWAIQGLIASGVSPASLHRDGAPSPVAYLASLSAPDGLIRYSRSLIQTPVWVTGEALMALQGQPLPLQPAAAETLPPVATAHRRAHTASRSAPRSAASSMRTAAAHRRASVAGAGGGAAQPGSSPVAQLEQALGMLTTLALAPLDVS